MTDPITDMFNRIRNAQAVLKETVSVPFSQLKYEIAKILERQSLVGKIEKRGRKDKKSIEIALKYNQISSEPKKQKEKYGENKSLEEKQDDFAARKETTSAIVGIKRISKPGQRIYVEARRIKPVRGGYGIAIISTSKGLMTDKEAKRQNLGGEIICEVW